MRDTEKCRLDSSAKEKEVLNGRRRGEKGSVKRLLERDIASLHDDTRGPPRQARNLVCRVEQPAGKKEGITNRQQEREPPDVMSASEGEGVKEKHM